MSYNSKNVKAVAELFNCPNRPNISEGAYQESSESSQNWGSYGQKETTYLSELSFKFHH